MRMLDLLGVPTVKENGCELGCRCESCLELEAKLDKEIKERLDAHAAPETLFEVLVSERRKRNGH